MESRTRQRFLRNGPQQVFKNDDSSAFTKLFAGFFWPFSGITASSLNPSDLVDYLVYAVKLDFGNSYKRLLVQSRHNLVAFRTVECASEQPGGTNKLAESNKYLERYSYSAVVDL